MACTCPNINCIQREELGITYCDCTTTITNIQCPPGCTVIVQPNGNAVCSCLESVAPTFEDVKIPVDVTDPTYFKDVSWTVAYSPIMQSWVSFYDFKPNYYISHNDYFQTGMSTIDTQQSGLWSHLLTNKSYQVFYGQRYPWIIEYTLKRSNNVLFLNTLAYQAESLRYSNEYDYALVDSTVFNKMWIFSPNQNSGELHLVKNNGTLSQISNYPKTSGDGKYQEILVSNTFNEYSVNYFYNRTVNNYANAPLWLWDENQIEKEVNTNAVKFFGKPILDNIRSRTVNIRLSNTEESRFRHLFNLGISKLEAQS